MYTKPRRLQVIPWIKTLNYPFHCLTVRCRSVLYCGRQRLFLLCDVMLRLLYVRAPTLTVVYQTTVVAFCTARKRRGAAICVWGLCAPSESHVSIYSFTSVLTVAFRRVLLAGCQWGLLSGRSDWCPPGEVHPTFLHPHGPQLIVLPFTDEVKRAHTPHAFRTDEFAASVLLLQDSKTLVVFHLYNIYTYLFCVCLKLIIIYG